MDNPLLALTMQLMDIPAVTPENRDDPNAGQVEYWNAAAGLTWARFHDALDRQIAPLGLEAIRRLAPKMGEQLLDVGCGCGQTTLELATRVGTTGSVLGVDISAPMLEIAATRQAPASSGRVEFRQADAQVAELGELSFDGVFSRFGVMFFGDPVAAFSNLHRALKPGGRLAFVCWRPVDVNPWMAEPMNAARPYLPPREPVDPMAPGPFAFADAVRLRDILGQAGFGEIMISQFDARIGGGTVDEALDLALRVGPLGSAIRENPALMPQLAGPVRDVLSRHETPQGVLMAASVWIVTGSSGHP
jgi:SAM-dependent methyltransferase